jgi:hypothetical protein
LIPRCPFWIPSEAHEAAEKAKHEYEDAQQTMEEWEDKDELPTDLNEWPAGKAKYVTFGGTEGDHGYDEGPETEARAVRGPPRE